MEKEVEINNEQAGRVRILESKKRRVQLFIQVQSKEKIYTLLNYIQE